MKFSKIVYDVTERADKSFDITAKAFFGEREVPEITIIRNIPMESGYAWIMTRELQYRFPVTTPKESEDAEWSDVIVSYLRRRIELIAKLGLPE